MLKNKYMFLFGAAVILFGLTAALVFSIPDQPDPGKKPETTTHQQKKEESHESTDESTDRSGETAPKKSVTKTALKCMASVISIILIRKAIRHLKED